MVMRRLPAVVAVAALGLTACNTAGGQAERVGASASPRATTTRPASPPTASSSPRGAGHRLLPGMPAPLSPHDIYAADRPGQLAAAVRHDPALVYVPNSESNTLDVIDQRTYRIVGHYPVGRLPQHVTPSYDLRK